MGDLGRQPITIFELDLPYCTRTYGVSPCNAVLGTTGEAKCFNSIGTCQFRAAYDAGVKTVSYCGNQDGVPDIPGIYPSLKSISTRAGELNLSGIDPKSTALGSRARVKVTLQDFQDADTWLDKYQSERVIGAAQFSAIGYNPLDQGQHLKRMFARFPYYLGLSARVRRGYVGDVIASMPTENYVMSELSGPSASGEAVLTIMDVIDLTDSKKAMYPPQSTGKILAAMDAVQTSVTITPLGIGDAEYPASGLVRIGREIMPFTRVGDVLTVTRGQEGTIAAAQSILSSVQICAVFDPQPIYTAINTLLTAGALIDPAQIDLAAWETENTDWYSGINISRTIISKSTGVKTLIGELCQLGVLVWGDPIANQIQYRVNSPLSAGETLYPINDADGLLETGIAVENGEELRISTVVIYHAVRDWTDDIASRNFDKATAIGVDENLYGQAAIVEIYCRWFGRDGNDATASVIAERLLSRFENVPKIVTGLLDVKDRASVGLGDRIEVTSYVLQDIYGAVKPEPMQVRYVEYAEDRVKFTAETFNLNGRFGYWMDATTDEMDYDAATDEEKAEGAYWWDNTLPDLGDGLGPYVWY